MKKLNRKKKSHRTWDDARYEKQFLTRNGTVLPFSYRYATYLDAKHDRNRILDPR